MKLRKIISAVLITALLPLSLGSTAFAEDSSNGATIEECETTLTITENGGLINFDYGKTDVDLLNVNSGIALIDDDGGSSDEFYNKDLSSLQYVTTPKNQGNLGVCWAFSATSCIETLLMKQIGESDPDLSELHAALASSSKFLQSDGSGYVGYKYTGGGNGAMYAMYSTRGEDQSENLFTGPVDETELKYTDSTTEINSMGADVMEISTDGGYFPGVFNSLDFHSTTLSTEEKTARNEIIKDFVDSYGSVSIAIYSGSTYAESADKFGSANGYTLFYEATQVSANHAVTIVGYDDSFEASNFTDAKLGTPDMDGAFIVKNSWGDSWGENGGYFYMSYDSYLDYVYIFGDLISRDTYDYEYDYTPYMAVGTYSWGHISDGQTVDYYFGNYANVFKKQYDSTEEINKISAYLLSGDCDIKLYVDTDATDEKFNSFQAVKVKSIGDGAGSYTVSSDGYTVTVPYAGNYVFELEDPIEVDNDFTVGVYCKSNNSGYFVAYEGDYGSYVKHSYNDNSYVSGITTAFTAGSDSKSDFTHLEDGNGNVSFMIRAYTEEVPVNVTVDGTTYEADYGTTLSEVLSDNGISDIVYEAVSGQTYKPADTTAAVTEDITLYTSTYISAPTIEMKNYQKYPESGTVTAIRFVGEINDSFYEYVDVVKGLGFVYSSDGGATTTKISCSDLYSSLVNYNEQTGVYLFKSTELDPGSYTVSAYVEYCLSGSEDVITVYTDEKTLSVS